MLLFTLTFVLCCTSITGQFMLSFGTPTPAAPLTFDPNCKDNLDTCWNFPESNCQAPYEQWAKDYCANRCGYCKGPTTPAPVCSNKLPNCELYGKNVCTSPDYKAWAGDNCRYYCRLCSPADLLRLDALITTIPPSKCVDKVDCRQYGTNACSAAFKAWSQDNCPNHCGYCQGIPTPPPACTDKIPNCAAYDKDTCSNVDYKLWVQDNCKKHCGLCVGGPAPAVTHAPSIPIPGSGVPVLTPPVPHLGGGIPTLSPVIGRDVVNHGGGAPPNQAPPTKTYPGQDIPQIFHTIPTPPPPGRRSAEHSLLKSRRQFEGSHHHHHGIHTEAPQEATNIPSIVNSTFPGDEFKPRPKPEENWDSKPSTEAPASTEKTKPPVQTDSTGMTTTTTEAGTNVTVPGTDGTDGSVTSSWLPGQTHATNTDSPTPGSTDLPASSATSEEPGVSTSNTEHPPTNSPTGTLSIVATGASNPPTEAPTTTTDAQPALTDAPTTTTEAPTTTTETLTQPTQASTTTTEAQTPPTQAPTTTTEAQTQPTQAATTTTDAQMLSTQASTSTTEAKTQPSEEPITTTEAQTPSPHLLTTTTEAQTPPTEAPTTTTTEAKTKPSQASTQGIPVSKQTPATSTETTSTAAPTASTSIATTTEDPCHDKIDTCSAYGNTACTDPLYKPWAKSNCPLFCDFCTPHTPYKCVDKMPNCKEFDSGDLCTASNFLIWARENCLKYCGFHPCEKNGTVHVSTAQTTTTTVASTTTPSNSSCRDKLENCEYYPDEKCVGVYEPWARAHCASRCGYCGATVCEDKIPSCSAYESAHICTAESYKGWARENCRKYCNLCTAPVNGTLATSVPGVTTGLLLTPGKPDIPPAPTSEDPCHDKIDTCSAYGNTACTDPLYKPWAKSNCPLFCDFCTPHTPYKCVDKMPNCKEFDSGDLCTASNFLIWARENCFKYCGFHPCEKNGTVHVSTAPTTITISTPVASTTPPSNSSCRDKIENCEYYSDEKCVGVYEPWARAYCASRCGYCGPIVCEDKIPSCSAYASVPICTSKSYKGWARKFCRKYCNLCTVPGVTTGLLLTPGKPDIPPAPTSSR